MSYCVYKHTFPDGHVYYGITSSEPNKRWANGHGYSGQSVMGAAVKKYGWNNIRHEVLASGLSEEDAKRIEHELIAASEHTATFNSAEKPVRMKIVEDGKILYHYCDMDTCCDVEQRISKEQDALCHMVMVYRDRAEANVLKSRVSDEGTTVTENYVLVSYYPYGFMKVQDIGKWIKTAKFELKGM